MWEALAEPEAVVPAPPNTEAGQEEGEEEEEEAEPDQEEWEMLPEDVELLAATFEDLQS